MKLLRGMLISLSLFAKEIKSVDSKMIQEENEKKREHQKLTRTLKIRGIRCATHLKYIKLFVTNDCASRKINYVIINFEELAQSINESNSLAKHFSDFNSIHNYAINKLDQWIEMLTTIGQSDMVSLFDEEARKIDLKENGLDPDFDDISDDDDEIRKSNEDGYVSEILYYRNDLEQEKRKLEIKRQEYNISQAGQSSEEFQREEKDDISRASARSGSSSSVGGFCYFHLMSIIVEAAAELSRIGRKIKSMDIPAKVEYAVNNAKPRIAAMYDMISSLESSSANMDAELFENFAQLGFGIINDLIPIYQLLKENFNDGNY